MTSAPSLTIAVVELAGGSALLEAVQRASELAAAHGPGQVELVVALAPSSGASGRFANCAHVHADTIPRRRRMALDATTTDILALIEDTILIDAAWIAHVLTPFEDPHVGSAWGPIVIDDALDSRSRALGALEYGRFAPQPQLDAPGTTSKNSDAIPGACMVYRTEALKAVMADVTCGVIEQEVAIRLSNAGWNIARNNHLISSYYRKDAYGARLSTRSAHGRLYASGMLAQKSAFIRLAFVARAALLPLVLTARAMTFRSPARNFPRSVAEFVWIASMATAWAFGEAIGAAAGEGSSERSWR